VSEAGMPGTRREPPCTGHWWVYVPSLPENCMVAPPEIPRNTPAQGPQDRGRAKGRAARCRITSGATVEIVPKNA
jgi:hypothetical protein